MVEMQSFIEKHDLLGCIQCGRCTGGCPVTGRTDLNIRSIIYQSDDQKLREELSKLPDIWDCTSCQTCALRCPKGLKPQEVLFGLRTMMIETGRIQSTVREALESTFREGNPWEKPRAIRYDWMEGLEVATCRPGDRVKNLVFVCCTIAYDPRVQAVAQNFSRLLKGAGIEHGFLSQDESCCGGEVFALGEDGLFEMMVEDNTELLNQMETERIITLSPHCYTTFKAHYPQLEQEVVHYTEFVDQMLREDQLELKGKLNQRVVYHDPCYLGKQNQIFDQPRNILQSIKGLELVEFERSRERSLCCGGGGGKMWVESEEKNERLAETRIKAAASEMEVDMVAVSCPFCLLTLEDAVKNLGHEEEIRVVEIMELLGEVE